MSGVNVCGLISTKEKKKKNRAGGEWIVEHSPKILAHKEKANNLNQICLA